MAQFKKGAPVRQIVKPITGNVEGFQVDQETGDLQVLVGWKDADGHGQSKYFKADELEADPDAQSLSAE